MSLPVTGSEVAHSVGETHCSLREARGFLPLNGWMQAIDDAFPWVAGMIIFVWVFTAVLGWIVRGFAGVPQGRDFRESADV